MNSLVVTRWRPHRPDGGAQLRNAQNITGLGVLGHVDVLSIGGPEVVEPVDGIRSWRHLEIDPARCGPRGAWIFRRRHHPLIHRYDVPEAHRELREMCAANDYDIAVVEEISLAAYVRPLKAAGIRVVFDAHNVETQLRAEIGAGTGLSWRAHVRRRVLDARLRAIERDAVMVADVIWACSEIDADAIRRLHSPRARVTVVPNAVNPFAYASARVEQSRACARDAPLALIYTGTFSYPPNEDAALTLIGEVLPAIRATGRTVRLTLVGREPTDALQRAAERDADVTLTGGVASILPFLSEPSIMPLPIRLGSGTRLKILEAFAAGCAVVSTRKGAEGIAATDRRDIWFAETPAEFAAAALELWDDPVSRRSQTEAALALVEACYSREAAGRAIRESLGIGARELAPSAQ